MAHVAPSILILLMRALFVLILFFVSHDCHATSRPNIVIIVADDLGYSDLGCYGSEIETPNLDGLARDGLRFSQFYNTARCWPTRAAVMTGQYPQQVRMDPQQKGGRLPSWSRTLPHYLKPAGYRSYHSGKWHVNAAPRIVADGGFDHSYALEDHNRNFNPRNHREDDTALPPAAPGSGYYSSTAITDHALKYLQDHATHHAQSPFFLYLAYIVPHFPLQAPAADVEKYRKKYTEGWDKMRAARYERLVKAGLVHCELSPPEPDIYAPSGGPDTQDKLKEPETYHAVPWETLSGEARQFQAEKMAIHAAMIDRMDQEIGRVLAQIKGMKAMENTLIVFLSDNGASAEILVRGDGHDPTALKGSAESYLCLGPGWSTACNTPFRRHKIWVHEGGISTPFIAHWPAGISARGELRHNPGHVVDLVPTVLEAAGIKDTPPWKDASSPPLAGRSLVPAFARDGTVTRDFIYFNHQGNSGLRMGNWKIVRDAPDKPWSLYDLEKDRGEIRDLASDHPARVLEMESLWKKQDEQFRLDAALPDAK